MRSFGAGHFDIMERVQASKSCDVCKARKKKCDKVLPHCGECARLVLSCTYNATGSNASNKMVPSIRAQSDGTPSCESHPLPNLTTASRWLEAFHTSALDQHCSRFALETSITNQVLDIISEHGDSIPLVCQRYFASIDVWLTIVSREDFENQMAGLQIHPSAESALLLLCMQVATCLPLQSGSHGSDTRKNYFAAKLLFNTLSSTIKASLRTIQAGVLLCLYEFGSDLVDCAHITLAVCSRLASQLLLQPSIQGTSGVQNTELGLTCWGINMLQICINLDTFNGNTPFILARPTLELEVPTDPDYDPILAQSVSEMDHGPSTHRGPFCRAAEAMHLLYRVVEYTSIQNERARINGDTASQIDRSLQSFLFGLLQQATRSWEECCAALGLVFIVGQRESSDFAIKSTTRMVIDIARRFNADKAHINLHALPVPSLTCIYRAVLMHMKYPELRYGEEAWLDDMDSLTTSLNFFSKRWSVGSNAPSAQ